MLQKHKRMALGIGVAVGTAGLVTAIAVPLALKNKEEDNKLVVIDKTTHAQVYTNAQALVVAATGNGITGTTVEKVSTKSNGDTIIEGSIATAAHRAPVVSTHAIKFVLTIDKDGIVLSYTENGADKTAVVKVNQARITTAFKESKLIEVTKNETQLKAAVNTATGVITPITGLVITPDSGNPSLTPGSAVEWTFSVAAKVGYKLAASTPTTFKVNITAPTITTPPATPTVTTVTKSLADLKAAVNTATGAITPITGLEITATANPTLTPGKAVEWTFSVAAKVGYQLATSTPKTFTVQVTQPTTAVSGWDKPLPTSTLYLKADGTYTTDETKAKEHVSEHMPAAVTIPAATVNSTVVIDGITYTGTAGGYALPSSQTAPTFKIGTKYYTTLQAAATAAGMTAVKTGFVSGTTYSANHPVDNSWTAITGTVYAKTAGGTEYSTSKPTDPDSSWTQTTAIGYAKADGTGYTETKPTVGDSSWVQTTAIGYAKADGTEYTETRPVDRSFVVIKAAPGVTLGQAPTNKLFSLNLATGIITDVAATVTGEIDVTSMAKTADISGKWISNTAADANGIVDSQPWDLDFIEHAVGSGYINNHVWKQEQPPIFDTTFTEHAVGSGYINNHVWKQEQPTVLKAGFTEYTSGFFKDKLFKETQPLDESYTSVSTGWKDASNIYYATDDAMKAAAHIEAAGSITYTATAINIDGSSVTPVAAGTATYPGIIAGPYYAKTGGGYVTAAKKTEAIGYVAPVSGTPVTISTPTTTTTITIDTTTYTYTVVPHASTLEQVYEI